MVYGILPLNALYKIIKEEGAERISENSVAELKYILEKKIKDVARISILIASNAGRKTIMEDDVKHAIEQIKGE
jgi:histone H3/H4